MKHGAKTAHNNPEHDSRQYRLLSASNVVQCWDDVPDALIIELVRSYTASGDAILFGTSKSQEVGAIRVYRGREPYSVYFRKAVDVGDAVDRLFRMRPPRQGASQGRGRLFSEAQGSEKVSLPFHPNFSRDDLIKQRQEAIRRANAWNALVDSIPRHFYRVASS